jgi:hypothetical protein
MLSREVLEREQDCIEEILGNDCSSRGGEDSLGESDCSDARNQGFLRRLDFLMRRIRAIIAEKPRPRMNLNLGFIIILSIFI